MAASIRKNVERGISLLQGCKVASLTYKCFRGVAPPSRQAPEKVPIRTAKVGCLFQLRLEIWQCQGKGPEVRPVETHGHTNHTLGSTEDALLLKPYPYLDRRAKELLMLGLTAMLVST